MTISIMSDIEIYILFIQSLRYTIIMMKIHICRRMRCAAFEDKYCLKPRIEISEGEMRETLFLVNIACSISTVNAK